MANTSPETPNNIVTGSADPKKSLVSHKSMLFVVVVIGLIGVVSLIASFAASSFASVEPENGSLSNGASVVADSGASSGKALKFGAATVTPPPTTAAYPKVASVQQNTGESWASACVRTMTYGYNGCVMYLPSGTKPSWNSNLQELASKVGNKAIYLQLTAKTHDDAGLDAVIKALPAAWKPGFIYNIYQEPEDNLLDAASQAAYRASYTSAAAITRADGVQLPWVEWQEWTTDPTNTHGWNLANFTPPAGDFGGVLWSLFEYSEKDRLSAQVPRIQAAMAQYAPGKPWGLMASAYTLEPSPGTATQQQAQAAWLAHDYSLTKASGSVGWAWYNVNFPGTGGASGEARVELNPYINLNNL